MQFFLFASLLAATATSPLSAPLTNGDSSASNTNVISPFVQIEDVSLATKRRYSTPAVVLIGTDSQLLRCLYKDPEQCEVLYTTGTEIRALLVVGEYIYAGLENKLLKCDLDQAESCQIYETCDTLVNSLTTAYGNLYAGLENYTVLTCGLDQINSCRVFHIFETPVSALMHVNQYMYVGLWNGKLMRCSLGAGSRCTIMYTFTAGISGLSSVGNSVFALLYYGDDKMLKCDRKPDAIDSCETVRLGHNYLIDMAILDGKLYTAERGGNIYICQWESNKTCTEYRNNIKSNSVAFSYATYAMESRYRDEDTKCLWQDESGCPPAVMYYNAQQRAHLQVHVKDGKLYNSQGALVDTSAADEGHAGPAAIFVMGPEGRIILSNSHKKGLLHTSSLLAGNPVAGAGEMVVKDGVIQKIRACSAHYRPDTDLNRQAVQSLRDQGYTDHIDSVMCSEGEHNQSESNVQ